MPTLHEYTSADDFVRESVQAIEAFINGVLENQRIARLALSGGQSPAAVYEALAESRIPWSRVQLFLVDERYAPLNSKDSNYWLIDSTLVSRVKNLRAFYSYNTKRPIEEIVKQYNQTVEQLEEPKFDLVILGLGKDGHTASLFPGGAGLHERRQKVVHTTTTAHHITDRMTLTFPAILSSRKIIFLVRGKDKAGVVDRWLHGSETVDEIPAKGVLSHPDIEVFFDRSL